MHKQVDKVKKEVISSKFVINEIPKAFPDKAWDIGTDSTEQSHFGIVDVSLSGCKLKIILIGEDEPESHTNNDRNDVPVIFLLTQMTAIINDCKEELNLHILVRVIR